MAHHGSHMRGSGGAEKEEGSSCSGVVLLHGRGEGVDVTGCGDSQIRDGGVEHFAGLEKVSVCESAVVGWVNCQIVSSLFRNKLKQLWLVGVLVRLWRPRIVIVNSKIGRRGTKSFFVGNPMGTWKREVKTLCYVKIRFVAE